MTIQSIITKFLFASILDERDLQFQKLGSLFVVSMQFQRKASCQSSLFFFSIMVTKYLLVSQFNKAISMVIPRSRSAFSLSKIQAYLKEPLPDSAASFSNFCFDVFRP